MTERLLNRGDFASALDGWGRFTTPSAGLDCATDVELIRGELDRTQLDLIRIDAERHVVTRTPEHVRRATVPLHIVTVHLRGRSVLTPGDGRAPVTFDRGDVGYWTSEFPYRWEFEGPLTLLMLRMPFAVVDIAPAALRPLIGRPFPSSSGFARLVVPFAEDVLTDPTLLIGRSGPRIAQSIVSLFTTMLIAELDHAPSSDHSAPAFLRVAAYITEHLSEKLDLRRIADDNLMSTRYLQSLFQERGTSVSEWIRLRRVESARQALADPVYATVSISQIAAQHGFADHAHFARTFRAKFDETPTQWRNRVRAGIH